MLIPKTLDLGLSRTDKMFEINLIYSELDFQNVLFDRNVFFVVY